MNDTITEAQWEHVFAGGLILTEHPVATVQFPSIFVEKGGDLRDETVISRRVLVNSRRVLVNTGRVLVNTRRVSVNS